MFTTQFWLIVIGLAQAIGFGWISSKVQKRSYKREIRSRHSYIRMYCLPSYWRKKNTLDAPVIVEGMEQERPILACRKE